MSTEIQRFIDQFKKTFVYEMLSQTLTDEQLFSHSIKDDGVIWFKEQMRQMWAIWLAGKTVPEGFVLVPQASLKVALFWMNEDIDPWQMGHDSFADLFEHKPILEKALIEAQEKNMNNQVCIGRHINGISINPLEYLLDESGQVKLFTDEAAAKAHLSELGCSDEDAYWMVFKQGNPNV